MTPPLVPPDITIPRLPWVPVYADRLWESDFWGVATDAEFRAAFCLWIKSWTQRPPGSLPNDDRILCRIAELGGNFAKWKKVKTIAMRHWVLCDDGRLYHPVVSKLVLEAAEKLDKGRRQTSAATANRWKGSNSTIRSGKRDGAKNGTVNGQNRSEPETTLDKERNNEPSSKAHSSPPYPLPNGKGEARPLSSSLGERERIAPDPDEQRELYAAVNEMRYARGDAYRAGKLKAWDAENGAKLQHACERLAELKTNGEEPTETLKPLGTVIENQYPTHQWAQPKPTPFAEQPVHTPRPRGRPRKDAASKPMFDA